MNPISVLALDIDGVLTNGQVQLGSSGEQAKALLFRDLDAIGQAKLAGLRIALVTGEDGPLVDAVAAKVGAERIVRGSKNKLEALHGLAKTMEIPLDQFCYVGDADRDVPALAGVGLGLAPCDASDLARGSAARVLHQRGGEGAVAEAVDLCLRILSGAKNAELLEASLKRIAHASLNAHQNLINESIPTLRKVSQELIRALRSGRKLLFCGNGGSAADSQHVAAELMGRFLINRDPWPAIALTTDSSILTAVGNDWEFAEVFARQVRALAHPGDVVIGISTSGNSENVVRAMQAAQTKGAIRIAFVGRKGGALKENSDLCFCAPTDETPRIQELHILAWHSICEVVEAEMVAA